MIKNPLFKFIFILFFILTILSTRREDLDKFFLYFLIILLIIFLYKVNLKKIFKKILNLIPFIFIFSLSLIFIKSTSFSKINFFNLIKFSLPANLLNFITIVIKSVLSILSIVFLIETTNIVSLIQTLKILKIPNIFLNTTLFIYRYFFVLLDEIKRMEIARDLRYFGGYLLSQIKVFSNIIGVLLIRSIERSERIYYAMKLRGYEKEIKTLLEFQIELKELLLFGFISSIVILIRIFI